MAKANKVNPNILSKFLIYMGLMIALLYFIYYLNVFPGAVDYLETEETITVERNTESETYIFQKSELDTSELLVLSILKMEIGTLQNFLVLFSVFIPLGLCFIIERDNYQFLNFNKRLKFLVLLLIFFSVLIFLAIGYMRVLSSIEENLKLLLSLQQQ